MDFRSLYYQITLSRITRIEGNLVRFLKGQNLTKEQKSRISEKKRKLKGLKRDFIIISAMKVLVFMIIYFSFISLVSRELPLVHLLTDRVAFIVGFMSFPVLAVFLIILEKASNVITIDAQCIYTEIVAIANKKAI